MPRQPELKLLRSIFFHHHRLHCCFCHCPGRRTETETDHFGHDDDECDSAVSRTIIDIGRTRRIISSLLLLNMKGNKEPDRRNHNLSGLINVALR